MNISIARAQSREQAGSFEGSQATYKVRRGDTLSKIAKRLDVSLAALKRANPQILNPNVIYPDQRINLPANAEARGVNRGDGEIRATASRMARVEQISDAIGGDGVTAAQLRRIVPGLSASKANEVAPHLNSAMREANINTPSRQAMFIAQLAHESGGFRSNEEIASGRAYEGDSDLGNTRPGDGVRFKGRGYIQITGRYNYTAASKALGLDLVNNPSLASRPENASRVAAWYWNSRGINAAADAKDLVKATRLINGGTNGLEDRKKYYDRAAEVLGSDRNNPAPPRNDPPSRNDPPRNERPRNDAPSGGSYRVRSGDTLSAIAARNDTTVGALMRANRGKIQNPDRIYAGQTINLPGGGEASAGGRAQRYTVRSGDTLSGIAERFNTSVKSLMSSNSGRIRDQDLIYAGQTIVIPSRKDAVETARKSVYTVRQGDTLSGIAERKDTTVERLMADNPRIKNPDLIYPGQILRISGRATGEATPEPNPPRVDKPNKPSNPPSGNNGNVPEYLPYTVYSTGRGPAFAVRDANQLQPHHSYQSTTRNGQRLEVRDVVLHRNGQLQSKQQVPAPLQGTVIHAGWMGTAGKAVGIRDSNGQVAWIFHMSSIDVRAGQRVRYGQDLGNQGTTGNSTGPHVHIEAPSKVIDRWVNDLLDGRFDGRNR